MTTDAFGHKVEFGVKLSVKGNKRKDGKYAVEFRFKSTGTLIRKLMTAEQIDADIKDAETKGSPHEVTGWPRKAGY